MTETPPTPFTAPDRGPAPVTRFAPSPTGLLHLGHAYSALFAAHAAGRDGRFLVRIEDIDQGRCRAEFEDAIFEDLAWLGLAWEPPVRRQSEHFDVYRDALAQLDGLGVLYPCFCTRKDIAREINEAQGAPHLVQNGPDGPLYPGTCRKLSDRERREAIATGAPYALRLDMARAKEMAIAQAGALTWVDEGRGEMAATPEIFGDVVLARKDTPTSYHLSVTLDDHIQGITLVTRGEDLLPATHIHRLLQALLGLNVPRWHHHPLLTGADGKRFAKRDKAETLRAMREAGKTPAQVREQAGWTGTLRPANP